MRRPRFDVLLNVAVNVTAIGTYSEGIHVITAATTTMISNQKGKGATVN